jgi:hypothetical protein
MAGCEKVMRLACGAPDNLSDCAGASNYSKGGFPSACSLFIEVSLRFNDEDESALSSMK